MSVYQGEPRSFDLAMTFGVRIRMILKFSARFDARSCWDLDASRCIYLLNEWIILVGRVTGFTVVMHYAWADGNSWDGAH